VNNQGLSVLDPGTGRVLGSGYNHVSYESILTDFIVIGDRAYAFGRNGLYAFRCPT
jgi:hypothetical protein